MDSYSYFSNKPTSIKHITLFGFLLNKAPAVPSSHDASRLKHTRKRTHILFLCCDIWLLCSWMLLYWALLATRTLCWQLQADQNWLDHHHCVLGNRARQYLKGEWWHRPALLLMEWRASWKKSSFFKLQNCSPKEQKFAVSSLSSTSPSSSRPQFLELTPWSDA